MPPRLRLLLSSLSVTLFVIAALPIYREVAQRRDIWWTPVAMLVPLAESKDRVEIYVRGEPLTAQLQSGHMRVGEGGQSSVLAASDIGLRFNNWDRVRADHMSFLLVCAGICGITALTLLLVLTGRLAYRAEETRS
jgi:hypothetical protein